MNEPENIKEILENITAKYHGKTCPICDEPLFKNYNGITGPRSCRCMVAEKEEHDKLMEKRRRQVLRDEIIILFESSMMGRRFKGRTFENFKKEYNKKAFSKAYSFAKNYTDFQEVGKNMVITGNVGTGKTHLAAAVSIYLMQEKLLPVVFGTWDSFLNKIKETFNNKYQVKVTENEIMSAIQNCDLLVIDDLGKEKQTDWTRGKLFSVIDYRYNNLLPVLITTNFDFDELMKWTGEAIASRINENCDLIEMIGKDYRRL